MDDWDLSKCTLFKIKMQLHTYERNEKIIWWHLGPLSTQIDKVIVWLIVVYFCKLILISYWDSQGSIPFLFMLGIFNWPVTKNKNKIKLQIVPKIDIFVISSFGLVLYNLYTRVGLSRGKDMEWSEVLLQTCWGTYWEHKWELNNFIGTLCTLSLPSQELLSIQHLFSFIFFSSP